MPPDVIIYPYTVRAYEGINWYIPYEIHVYYAKMLGEYYYIARDLDLDYNVEFSDVDTHPIFISKVNVSSDYTLHLFTFKIDYTKESTYDLTGVEALVSMRGRNFSWMGYIAPTPLTADSGYFTFDFSHAGIPYGDLEITINLLKSSTIHARYKTSSIIKYNLFNYTQSQLVETASGPPPVRDLLDVPGIEKDWFDSLSADDKKLFEKEVLQKMITLYDSTSMRMMNTFINYKMPKTKGILSNIYFNPENVTVKKLVVDRTDVPLGFLAGDQFAIKGPVTNPADPFYGKEGAIALCLSTVPETWRFDYLSISSIIFNEFDSLKYFYDGYKWFRPNFDLPIKIEAIMYTKDGYLTYIDKAKIALLNYFSNRFGLDKPIYRSEIISILQQIEGVVYVKLLKPEIDILFNYKMEDLDYDHLVSYVPEYIWFNEDDIYIDVRIG
ncbi:hypothetical protein M0R36_11025 [bacterium]|jgi:hypothetical protein|nr:hypothetical protein [bacterium]